MANRRELTRRMFIGGGACAMTATTSILNANAAQVANELGPENEATIRQYYKLWETKEWAPLDLLLAGTFTFTSAAGDDHIGKSAFKTQCWDTQIGHTKGFEVLELIGRGNFAFIMYIGHTTNNQSFRNVEFMQVRHGKVESIECYFGQNNSFPSAVSGQKK